MKRLLLEVRLKLKNLGKISVMHKDKILILTTSYRHTHRFRLHNFLPYLSQYLEIDILDIAPLGYDKSEDLINFIKRIMLEFIRSPYLHQRNDLFDIITIRNMLPGDFGPFSSLPLTGLICHKVKRRYYSAILATPFLSGLLAILCKKEIDNIPVIYEDVDRFYDFFKEPVKKLIVKALESYIIKASDAVIAVSPYLYIEDRYVRNNNKTFFVPNGIEYKKIRKIASEKKIRDEFTIVYVGAIEWWSGLDLAIDSMAYITKKASKARLIIIGEYRTPYGIKLLKRIKSLNLSDKVIFLGRRSYSEVIELLSRSYVGIQPFPISDVTLKAFPYKILEYGAAGLPIVMTNVSVLAKFVEKYKAGFVVKPNPEEFANAVLQIFSDKKLWLELSANSIKMASLFDVEKLAREEANIIMNIAHLHT